MHPRGFGFVRLEGPGDDVFVPPRGMRGAMHGDRVRVRSVPSSKGRDGEVLAIEERWVKRVTGIVRGTRRRPVLEPDFLRLRGPMPIEEGRAYDQEPPPSDVRELAPESRRVSRANRESEAPTERQRRRERKSRDAYGKYGHNEVVVAEITHYPDRFDEVPVVRLIRSLGYRGRADVEVERVKVQEGVEEVFSAPVRELAEKIPKRIRPKDREGREDLRDYDLVTIDPPDARDHDDALWAQRQDDGSFRVVIAIADVSHYVEPHSAIDEEAQSRGCSIYLPDRAIPMLPEELSSHMASLVPGKDRLCMAVEVHIGARGKLISHRIFRGIMRSRARLTYGGAARALGLSKRAPSEPAANARREMLRTLYDLSKVMRKKRAARGRLDFELPEARVQVDEQSREPTDVYRSKSYQGIREAYQLVEEMMLLANEVVATTMVKKGFPCIFRVHGAPQEEKVESFLKLAEALGAPISKEDAKEPKRLAAAVRRLAKSPQASIVHYLLLRSLPQAQYDTENIGHFGLAATNYLHFTSPIRRYPDLVVHRMVKRYLDREKCDEAVEKSLKRIAVESSRLERRASTVERAVVDVYRIVLMLERIGEEFEGTVTGVEHFGVYVTLDAPFVEALLPIERLGHEPFSLDTYGIRLAGERSGVGYAMGDRLRIRLEEANLTERRLIGSPVWLPDLEHPLTVPDPRREEQQKKGDVSPERRKKRKSRRGGRAETRSTETPKNKSKGKGSASRSKKGGGNWNGKRKSKR